MNWLAHIFVSGSSVDYQLGNLLADPLKGKPWENASEATRQGFAMHKVIDHFTDHHPAFLRSKKRLGEQGFLRGVVVDMVYDHLLTRNWPRYAQVDREAFMAHFYQRALAAATGYPEQPRHIVERIVGSDYLGSYTELAGLRQALERIDRRLKRTGRGKKPAADYMPAIESSLDGLQRDFTELFPDLLGQFKGLYQGEPPGWMK